MTPEDRTRQRNRKNQAAKRKREAEHRSKVGAEILSFDIYRSTRETFDMIKERHGMDEAEAVTVLLFNLNGDMSLLDKLLQIPKR